MNYIDYMYCSPMSDGEEMRSFFDEDDNDKTEGEQK